MSHAATTMSPAQAEQQTLIGVGSGTGLCVEPVTLEKISSPQGNTCIDPAENTNAVAVLLPARSNSEAKAPKPAARNKIEVNCQTATIIIKYKNEERRCIIDKSDLPAVQKFKWSYHYRGAITQAEHKKGYLMLAKVIAQPKPGTRYYFKNGDCWDCRRQNIILGKKQIKSRFRSDARKIYYNPNTKKWLVNADIKVCGKVIKCHRKTFNNEQAAQEYLDGISPMLFVEQFIARSGQRGLEKYKTHLVDLFSAALVWNEHRQKTASMQNLKPVNLYEGNADYENCVAEVPLNEETGMWDGFNLDRRD